MRLKNLVRINKEYLFADDQILDFNIYTVRSSDNTPILLVGKDSSVLNLKETLRHKQLGQLFVDKRDYKRFQLFMEDSIGTMIDDSAIPLQKKSEVIYTCAKDIMIDVFDDPRSGENIRRARNISDNIIRFALTSYESIPSILKLGSRDYYTFSHCVNVSVFFIGLWLMIGNGNEEELRECALGCLLHDIGKSEIDGRILNKPGRLTDTEFEVMKGHPLLGHNLMLGHVPQRALKVILHHHEKANGKGYPYGLKEDQICDSVKISTIADVYDALTTERPYANARTPFKALMLMKEEMVGHFEHKKFTEFVTFLGGQQSNGSPPYCC
ncbi:MAG: HD-GYP domain-containing protein [Thermodesulfobacteriota bacterium]